MPSIRVGFGSDYVVKNQSIGIGTDNPRARLDVLGTLKGDISVSGVNTLSLYAGFVPEIQNVNENLTLTGEFTTVSEDIVVGAGVTFIVSDGSTFAVGSLESISVQSHFSVPNGGTSTRTADPVEGMVRFNDDLNTLEFWNGFEWRQFTVTGASGRGVFGGGYAPSMTSLIEYINISSTGNSQNFGNLTESGASKTAMSSSIRGLFSGGGTPAYTNTIDYITIASEGNAIDFGDGTTLSSWGRGGLSSSTRGIMGGGFPANNIIDYVTIATLGNALDFGDLTVARHSSHGLSSPTRGVWGGGNNSGTLYDTIDYITIASTGDAKDFGNLSESRTSGAGFSSSTRGIWSGGNITVPLLTNTIDYITIASTGNATDFGDAIVSAIYRKGNSSNTRGVNCGGRTPTITNTIEYVTIASTGNAQDFGDLSQPRDAMGVASDSHGGLGGF